MAFDNLYSIRHQRSGINQVGFVIQHTPKPNDKRPNLLLEEEANPLFSRLGYHQKDFNIYTWALLEQIDRKLTNCKTILSTSNNALAMPSLSIFPNPSSDWIYLKYKDEILINEAISILDFTGKTLLSSKLDDAGGISIQEFGDGLYFVKTNFGIHKIVRN